MFERQRNQVQSLVLGILAQNSGMERSQGGKHAGSKFYFAVFLVRVGPLGRDVVVLGIQIWVSVEHMTVTFAVLDSIRWFLYFLLFGDKESEAHIICLRK